MQTFSAVVFIVFLSTVHCTLRTDQVYWQDLAAEELQEALQVKWNTRVAKNVILFVGDGMGPNTVTATRIFKGGESHRLVYEKFPHVGLLKTYSANKMVPDSACTATALFCGVKANQETIGVDATVNIRNCSASLNPDVRLKSLAAIALEAGKRAGLVTTMRVTHATPAPMYAHSADRRWECDSKIPPQAEGCKDHARQLVEDWPGRDLHVIMGGGRQVFVSNLTVSTPDPWGCQRKDGRNLIKDYKKDKESRGLKYTIAYKNKDLTDLDVEHTDYLLGIFANGHLKYEYQRDQGPEGSPSLTDMVDAAIKVLRKGDKGFFLMVEGGNIDMAHHRGRAKTAVHEAAAMEDAVIRAMELTDERETLLIVTSDHAHTLNINGYPLRGTNIFGIAAKSPYDGLNFTTLSYSTGGPASLHYTSVDGKVVRKEPLLNETDSFEYQQISAIIVDENCHGGGDVVIYAKGPHAHLFHNVHEQHYVYHAISYAAKMGAHSAASTVHRVIYTAITVIIAVVCLLVVW